MRRAQTGEEGYLLIAVLFMMALLLFALATAAPRVSYDLRRDREVETVHRGMQYARAIQLYYRKFGHYPVSIDELLDSNHLRFLRRKYVDPMTGKQDWRLIHVGQAKTMRTGAPSQVGIPAGQAGQNAGPTDPNSLFGGSSAGGTAPGPAGLQGGLGLQGGSGLLGGSGLQGGQTPGGIVTGITPVGGTGQISPSTPGDSSGSGSAGGTSNQPGDAAPGSNIGGGPIVGVSSTNPGSSIKVIRKMQHYNEWEFIYDPSLDLGGLGGANGTQPVAPVGGQQNPLQNPTDQPTPNSPTQTTPPAVAPTSPNPYPNQPQ